MKNIDNLKISETEIKKKPRRKKKKQPEEKPCLFEENLDMLSKNNILEFILNHIPNNEFNNLKSFYSISTEKSIYSALEKCIPFSHLFKYEISKIKFEINEKTFCDKLKANYTYYVNPWIMKSISEEIKRKSESPETVASYYRSRHNKVLKTPVVYSVI